jgi:hypothetical protein
VQFTFEIGTMSMTLAREVIAIQAADVKRRSPSVKAPRWSWADVADSEGEELDAILNSEAYLTTDDVGLVESGDARPSKISALNASAPEFIPTMSMVCPLMCVLEASMTPSAPSVPREQQRRWGIAKVVSQPAPAMELCDTAELAAPHLHSGSAPNPAACGGGEDLLQRRRRKKAGKGQQPTQVWGEMPEVSEEVWEERIAHRHKVLGTLEARLQRLCQNMIITEKSARGRNDNSAGEDLREVARSVKPDPEDRTVSRRQWRKAVDNWFKASLLQCECQGSVVSTEECISTNCDGESECSE